MTSMHLVRNGFPCAALAAAVICCGCGNVADKDPWIRVQKCTIQNVSSSPIEKAFLRCIDREWKTEPIDVLQPGESKEIALPNDGIPRAFVNIKWKESATSHMGILFDMSKTKGPQQTISILIEDNTAKVETTAEQK